MHSLCQPRGSRQAGGEFRLSDGASGRQSGDGGAPGSDS